MVGWHHGLNGHEFKQAPGDGEGQGSLACCSPWGHKESDVTGRLNNHCLHRVTFFSFPLDGTEGTQPVPLECQVWKTDKLSSS